MSNPNSFSFQSLSEIRKRLLDLSVRNALLNYRFPRGKSVEIFDISPDVILERLMSGKGLDLEYIDYPTEKELKELGYEELPQNLTAAQWAKDQGRSWNKELPSDSTQVNPLVLMFADNLSAVIKKIRQENNLTLSETGSHVLHLCVGFLEWHDGSQKRLAPLLTLPIHIEATNKRGRSHYFISLKEDVGFVNLTLSEKLKFEFDLELPEWSDDSTPESYFRQVQHCIEYESKLSIKRRACVALLNFSKQAMYQDLNPETWQDCGGIENHPILQELFNSSSFEYDSQPMQEEYHIDEYNEEIHQTYPLIYDADSSQHSALIDAVSGKNLVIEGPPGTGKSQTITNLIASFVNDGKKVLFVAEKMAALNVVKDRLDKAGLGGFCLELHSNKTNKQKILSDLISQSNKHYGNYREELNSEINAYEKYKNELNQYVREVNGEYKDTQVSIHYILNRATNLSEELKTLGINPKQVSFSTLDEKSWDKVSRNEMLDKGRMLKTVYQKVAEQSPNGNIAGHYWHGMQKHSLTQDEQNDLIISLSDWTLSLEKFIDFKNDWRDDLKVDLSVDDEQSLEDLVKISEQLPRRQDDELFLSEWFEGDNLLELSNYIEKYQEYFRGLAEVGLIFKTDTLNNTQSFEQIDEIINNLSSLSLSEEQSFLSYEKYYQKLIGLTQDVLRLSRQTEKVQNQIPSDLTSLFVLKLENFKEWEILIGLITQLPKELWQYRAPYLDDDSLDDLLLELAPVLREVQRLYNELDGIFVLDNIPNASSLEGCLSVLENGGFFKYLSSEWRTAKAEIMSLSAAKTMPISQLQKSLPKLISYKELLVRANAINQASPVLGHVYQGVDTPIEKIIELRDWYRRVRQEYGLVFSDRNHIGSALLKLDAQIAFGISAIYHEQLKLITEQITMVLDELNSVFQPIFKLIDEHHDLKDSSVISTLIENLELNLAQLNKYLKNKEAPLSEIRGANLTLKELHDSKEKWMLDSGSCPWRQHWQFSFKVDEHATGDVQAALNTMKLFSAVRLNEDLELALRRQFNEKTYDLILEKLSVLKVLATDQAQSLAAFVLNGEVDKSLWLSDANLSPMSIEGVVDKNQKAIQHKDWLYNWSKYLSAKRDLSQGHLEGIIHLLESGKLPAEKIEHAIELAIFYQLQEQIFSENALIREFNSAYHQAKIEMFRNYDKTLMELQRKQIAYQSQCEVPGGVSTGAVGNYSDFSLIRHEYGKRSRHIPIRQLFARSAKAIQALKPCLMMSPMSVAQYLQAGSFEFDVVIMDEASQILPEFAIGALARIRRSGGSVVIVGDPKQLPPTNFFSTNYNEDEDEDILAIQESESILETVSKHPSFHHRRLRWHYRSRHESLIAFSNRQFYDSDLVLFPSPMGENDELGIRFHRIDGVYGHGVNSTEATAIVQKAIDILETSPNESIGIVAMNTKQRDEIERCFNEQLEANPSLQVLYDERSQKDPVFIKNLENVQGDERDVILISMTYGPENIGGRTYQRFGPINSKNGWRRLNVLLTRAKKRMHIFSSMGSGDVLIGSDSSKGVQSLQAFLHYCETGRLGTQGVLTGKSPDSDFEVAVMKALSNHGYECEPQVGVNGFFIDIAVRNPTSGQGQFLIGIECDGATYHSSKSARDRDRLRQEILENLGWEIHRIWSTDWFRNPQAALQPILHRLKSLTSE